MTNEKMFVFLYELKTLMEKHKVEFELREEWYGYNEVKSFLDIEINDENVYDCLEISQKYIDVNFINSLIETKKD